MNYAPNKPRFAMFLFVPVFLLYGTMGSAAGYYTLADWPACSPALRTLAIFWIFLGPAMLIAAAWVVGSLGRSAQALKIGGAATILFGALRAFSSFAEIVPCSGPA